MLPLIRTLIDLGYPEDRLFTNLLPCFQSVVVPKTQIVKREGAIPDKLFFIAEGLGRMYYREKTRSKGRVCYVETTRSVAGPGEWFTEPVGFLRQEPSAAYLELCGPARAYGITYADYRRLRETDPDFRQVADLLWASLFESGDWWERILRMNTAIGDRMHPILAKYPQLRELAPDRKVWASLAGVSEATLKRWLAKQRFA